MGRNCNANEAHGWQDNLVRGGATSARRARVRVRDRRHDVGRRSPGAALGGTVVRPAKIGCRRARGATIMKMTLLACVALCVVVHAAAAQDPRLRAALDPDTFAKVSRIIDSARA